MAVSERGGGGGRALPTYNGYPIVVDVRLVVQFVFKLSVFGDWLDTTGVEGWVQQSVGRS